MIIDLRSDTFTRPGPAMLEAMMKADVGDDVFGEDHSVNQLEAFAAEIFGMEAGIFCPSGTMTNQIAIKCHTQAGQEVICDKDSHVYLYECGGIAFNSACQVKTLEGQRGMLMAEQIEEAVNPDDVHRPVSSLVSLENTANRGGGACYNFAEFQKIKDVCLKHNMKLHLDGARIFNAILAKNENPKQYGNIFNSISICLSKGLGAPVGSVLLGSSAFIKQARRVRKLLGGGMRQAGYLAAAGIYALENNVNRLALDHENAHRIAELLIEYDFIGRVLPVETNILIFEVTGKYNPKEFAAKLKQKDILCIPISATQVRMVTHLDISNEMVNKVLDAIKSL
ncbi:MAG: threonine aldolase [Chitinophagaceae bacterium]|nr:threonine aldolase [Chitinophagaceae bacterium]